MTKQPAHLRLPPPKLATLAVAATESRNWSDAAIYWKALLDVQETSPLDVSIHLAQAYRMLGRFAEARSVIRHKLDQYPDAKPLRLLRELGLVPKDSHGAERFLQTNWLVGQRHRPLLIIGNGPSTACFDPRRIPENPVVFRINLFMLENEYRFGSHADAVFWAIGRRILQDALEVVLRNRLYSIAGFFCPATLMAQTLPLFRRSAAWQTRLFYPKFCHWDLFRMDADFDPFFFNRKHGGLPTCGFQALATGLLLGFKEIYLAGFDFYKPLKTATGKADSRYGHILPEYVKLMIAPEHTSDGYEQRSHSERIDGLFFKMLCQKFKAAKIYSAVPESPLSDMAPIARPRADHFRPDSATPKDMGLFHRLYRQKVYQYPGRLGEIFQEKDAVLFGWAWDSTRPHETETVTVHDAHGRILKEVRADLHFFELDKGGIGNARHGFKIDLNSFARPSPRQVSIRLKNGPELHGSPVRLPAPRPCKIAGSEAPPDAQDPDWAIIKTSGMFDEDWYFANYPWVLELKADPVAHYLEVGARNLYDPSPFFNTRYYVESHLSTASGDRNPLVDFILRGEREGLCPYDPAGSERDLYFPHPFRIASAMKNIVHVVRGREHFWYDNHALRDFRKQNPYRVPALPPSLRRILVVGHDFELITGVMRSLSHYINAMLLFDRVQFTSVEFKPDCDVSALKDHVVNNDFVIFNSLAPFINNDGMTEIATGCGRKKCAVYLHETEWGFDKVKESKPEKFNIFAQAAPDFNFFCVSQKQSAFLEKTFGARHTSLVYETTVLPKRVPVSSAKPALNPATPLLIVMAGTLQPRKGVSLFSEVADLCHEKRLPWRFHWAGSDTRFGKDVYRSPHVIFRGKLAGMDYFSFLQSADVFFLSSADDPFPLSCLEALQSYKRLIVYRESGISEILGGVSGTGIFNDYTPDAAFAALRDVIHAGLDVEAYQRLQARFSLAGFVKTLNAAITRCYTNAG